MAAVAPVVSKESKAMLTKSATPAMCKVTTESLTWDESDIVIVPLNNRQLENTEEDFVQVPNEQLRWIEKDKAEMLEDMAERNIEELVDAHHAEQNDRWRQWYSTMPEEGFDKTDTWKRAVGTIENMLISQSR